MTRWSAASVRLRLTAWYSAVLTLVLVAYAAATYVAVRREFSEQQEKRPGGEIAADEQVSEVLAVLVIGLPPTVALAAVGGYVLARRALAPVEASFEQLRRFTADASHELRTPLAVMRGIGEMGVAGTRTASEYKDTIGSMLEEVDRLTRLVETLLRLSHGDAGTIRLSREPLDLAGLASDAAASLAVLAEERDQRVEIVAADGVSVAADRLVLREAVTNILDNAIKYSPPGSTIVVSVDAAGGDAVLAVADEGPGIAVEHRERIFDRFYRVDEGRARSAGGAGLGLAIAKWAVDVHGGRIAVDQPPTGGSVFRIVLPMRDGRTDAAHRERMT